MKTDFIKGIIPPVITPIDKDEKIDEKTFRRHLDFMLDGGIHGILAFGSNGEFYMFDEDDMEKSLKIIIDQNKNRVPVYLGIGDIRTSKCIRLAKMGVRLGVDGISILQPMFIKPSEEELREHLVAIAKSVPETPVLLYNNPGRTGYPMSQNLVEYMAHEIKNVVGMKDSSGDMTHTSEFIRRNRDVGFKVMCGKDTLIHLGMCSGAVGAVCSTANFLPELVCSIYQKYIDGDIKGSLEAQYVLNPIRLQMDKSTFPVSTKDYANLLGLEVGNPVLPTKPSPEPQMEEMRKRLQEQKYL